MSLIPWLFVFYLLGRRKQPSSVPAAAHAAATPRPKPQTGPAAFPSTPSPSGVPVSMPSGPTFSKKWVPYKPLNAAVIARAEQILRDATHPAPFEHIEKDPAGSGSVRYLKVSAPQGHLSVTAWRPTLAAPSSHVIPG